MSNYVQTTFFTPKDSLPPSNPAKTIFGAAYDVEFGNISSAIASKYDSSSISAGPIAFALGSAAAPSVTFLGELGTGLYSNVSGDLGCATAGTARLTVSGSTGLTTALAGLTVSGGTTTTAALSSTTGNFSQNVVLAAPTSGTTLIVNQTAALNVPGVLIQGVSTAGQSNGLIINAGNANAADRPLDVLNYNATVRYLGVFGDGGVVIGAPTGGSKGAGTLNVGTAIYINNVAVTAGTVVSSLAGTANQIAVSASTGAITISIPANVVIPTPGSGVALTITGVSGLNIFPASITGGSTAGQSNGLIINAGAGNAADRSLDVLTQNGATRLFGVFGDGGVVIGGPTGGDQGSGTLNIATALYLAGNPIYSGIPQNSQSANYVTVLTDANKHIYHPTTDNNARTFTIAANSSVAYPIGTAITFDNDVNVVTLAINTDTLVWLPTGATGSRSIAAQGQGTALKVTATRWHLTGVGIT